MMFIGFPLSNSTNWCLAGCRISYLIVGEAADARQVKYLSVPLNGGEEWFLRKAPLCKGGCQRS